MLNLEKFEEKSLDYLTAVKDVAEAVRMRRARDWNYEQSVALVYALGRAAETEIDKLLNKMEERASE